MDLSEADAVVDKSGTDKAAVPCPDHLDRSDVDSRLCTACKRAKLDRARCGRTFAAASSARVQPLTNPRDGSGLELMTYATEKLGMEFPPLAEYRAVLVGLIPYLLRHGARFESTDEMNWRIRATPRQPNLAQRSATPTRPQKKKKTKRKKNRMSPPKRRLGKTPIDGPSVSVRARSGGLPGSGKRA